VLKNLPGSALKNTDCGKLEGVGLDLGKGNRCFTINCSSLSGGS